MKKILFSCTVVSLCRLLAADGMPATCQHMSNFPIWAMTYHSDILCFVGTDPRNGPADSYIDTLIVPVKAIFHGTNNEVVATSDPTSPLATNKKLSVVDAVKASPLFQAQEFKFGDSSVGTAQWLEATMRASFWKFPGVRFDSWHVTLLPSISATLTLDIDKADWSVDAKYPHVRVATDSAIDSFVTSQMATGLYGRILPIFLFYNLKETSFGGYHRGIDVGGVENLYIFAAYFDPPYGVTDVHPLSHELAEFAHDPFGSNLAPWPKNVKLPWKPPYVFSESDCQSNLEVGDPVETRPAKLKDLSIANSTMTYNFANIALAPWFLQASPSYGVNEWYTLNGAIDGEFGAPAPACPSVSGVAKIAGINPATGTIAGGTKVTVTGSALSKSEKFKFDGTPASKVACGSSTKCTMVTPAHAPGIVSVIATSSAGESQPFSFTYAAPTISSVSPSSGPLTGGTTVTVDGSELVAKFKFEFDGTPASKVACASSTKCTMVTPAHKPGDVNVVVKSSAGDSPPVTFHYDGPSITGFSPKVGPTTGGLPIRITGAGLSDKMTVKFGPNAGSKVDCGTSSTSCAVNSGMGSVDKPVTLTVTVDGVTSEPSSDEFSFVVFPTLTDISPGTGAIGSTVTLTGTGFSTDAGGTTFTFGGLAATGVTCASKTNCTAVVPGFATQSADVEVTVDGHTSLKGVTFTNSMHVPPPSPM